MNYRILVKSSAYRLLWMKIVTGFDPSHCCAKSLLGSYVKGIAFGAQPAGRLYEGMSELGPHVGYLCGVTARYDRNLHVAFRESPGDSFDVETDDIQIHIQDAVRIAVPQTDVTAPTAKQAACRNYRFGKVYFEEAALIAASISSDR